MLNADKALAIVLKASKPRSSERVKLREALGRTLAEDIIAAEDIPPFDNSSMDGFAVRAADLARASARRPVTLTVVGEASAGNVFGAKLRSGEAVRIMTGGKIPAGADSVVPIELVTMPDDRHVRFESPVKRGANIRRAGEDIARNTRALKKGEVLTPARLGILAALGYAKVRVAQRPKVNILATGDELVPVRKKPQEGQIRNSSSYVLQGYVEQAGGEPVFLGIVGDKKRRLRKAIAAGLDADILLITGGVSVGKYDLVGETLQKLGVQVRFWRVNIKPGKPLLFGTFKKTLVFGLPGNPVSTGVTFLQFVRPALFAMLGRSVRQPMRLPAILDEPLTKHDSKRHYVRGIAVLSNGALHVTTTGSQSSGMVSSLAKANCLIVIPEAIHSLRKGSTVEVEFLE
jgi:molybdopterin molybdotransferase